MIDGFKKFFLAKLVNESGNTISKANPLPIFQLNFSALSSAAFSQCVFSAHGVNVPASAGNNSKIELFNPADSGKILVCYVANLWHTSGSVTYKASLSSSALSASESSATKRNIVAGSAVTSVAKIYTKNNDATSATDVISQVAVSSTTPNGTNIIPLFQGICLPNSGFRIESTTANMAINAVLVWAEYDLTDIPTI